MQSRNQVGVAYTTAGMRRLLAIAAMLVFIAGIQLFVLTDHTDAYFAWTIIPPITTAFLGAGYWSSCILEVLAARRKEWARTRIAVPSAFTFTTLTLVATLLDLNKFHFGAAQFGAQLAAWAWLVVYVLVPSLFLAAVLRQLRVPGTDPPRNLRMPRGLRRVLWAQGAVMALFGLLLFLIPQTVAPIWPWNVTPLSGRAIAAWLLAMAVAAFHALWEDDLDRVLPAIVSYAVFGVLQIVAVMRYGPFIRWSNASAWVYFAFCVAILITGIWGYYLSRRHLLRRLSEVPPAEHRRPVVGQPVRKK